MKVAKTKTRAAKRTDRGIPFEEMLRLMRIYGSVKCLRKRQNPEGEEYTKTRVDSVKRKFYRWFPDLDERFSKDEHGMYWPKCGHESEIRYREEMRKKDGQILVTKRVTCRRDRHGASAGKAKEPNHKEPSASRAPGRELVQTESNLMLNPNDPLASFSATVDVDSIDCSFLAEERIFDDVDSSFYGLPSQVLSSCSSSADDEPDSSSSSWDSDNANFIDDDLTNTIVGCDEILSSDDSDSVTGYLFDLVSD
jgi:hypothetical protein